MQTTNPPPGNTVNPSITYTTTPCPRCGSTTRYRSNRACVECSKATRANRKAVDPQAERERIRQAVARVRAHRRAVVAFDRELMESDEL